jgi:hypothetical protein
MANLFGQLIPMEAARGTVEPHEDSKLNTVRISVSQGKILALPLLEPGLDHVRRHVLAQREAGGPEATRIPLERPEVVPRARNADDPRVSKGRS